jgi:hypothetical protein
VRAPEASPSLSERRHFDVVEVPPPSSPLPEAPSKEGRLPARVYVTVFSSLSTAFDHLHVLRGAWSEGQVERFEFGKYDRNGC